MEVHIAGDRADLRAEPGDLISQHAWGWDLDCIVPVVVVVAKGIREVQDGHLADRRRVLGNIEMRRLDRALRHRVRHKEEIKLAIDDLGLLNKARIDVCSLGWVIDEVLSVVSCGLLEESLSDSLVNDDQSDLRVGLSRNIGITGVLHGDDAIELLELHVNNLLAHGITDTITIDEDVFGHGVVIEIAVGLE